MKNLKTTTVEDKEEEEEMRRKLARQGYCVFALGVEALWLGVSSVNKEQLACWISRAVFQITPCSLHTAHY